MQELEFRQGCGVSKRRPRLDQTEIIKLKVIVVSVGETPTDKKITSALQQETWINTLLVKNTNNGRRLSEDGNRLRQENGILITELLSLSKRVTNIEGKN